MKKLLTALMLLLMLNACTAKTNTMTCTGEHTEGYQQVTMKQTFTYTKDTIKTQTQTKEASLPDDAITIEVLQDEIAAKREQYQSIEGMSYQGSLENMQFKETVEFDFTKITAQDYGMVMQQSYEGAPHPAISLSKTKESLLQQGFVCEQ